jgi:hypothetical protein
MLQGSRSIHPLVLVTVLAGALHGACAEDLSKRLGPDAAPAADGPVEVEDLGDGVHQARVDAKDEMQWIYVNLEQGKAVPMEAEGDATAWDLALQRFHLKLNGGASGSGNAAVALLPGAAFDDVAEVPADATFLTDQADADGDGLVEYVMSIGDTRWYAYDVATHVLTPKDLVYVVRGANGSYYKLEMLEYYDAAGTAGYPAFRWAALDGPAARPPAPAAVRASGPPAPQK